MKDQVFRIEYFTLTMDDRPGVGADLGRHLAKENVSLLGLLEVPYQPGKVHVELIPDNPEILTRAARKLSLVLSEPKFAFLIQGIDRPDGIADHLEKLSQNRINVRTMMTLTSGGDRYGALVFVEPSAIEEATRALDASVAMHRI